MIVARASGPISTAGMSDASAAQRAGMQCPHCKQVVGMWVDLRVWVAPGPVYNSELGYSGASDEVCTDVEDEGCTAIPAEATPAAPAVSAIVATAASTSAAADAVFDVETVRAEAAAAAAW